ncbi:MAG: hypothetical protein AAF725_26185, partial [Acidobacteriota bacterium]
MADLEAQQLERIAESDRHKPETLPHLKRKRPKTSKDQSSQQDCLEKELAEKSSEELWRLWKSGDLERARLRRAWPHLPERVEDQKNADSSESQDQEAKNSSNSEKPTWTDHGYYLLARALKDLGIGATWATLYNRSTWALLNVHRDTLRELGLFLEDLYSWSPKELRSVVLESILAQDQETRRTVVDRWFNRTDYRRSQILSLLAANVFRPWMLGEEPYGDEQFPIAQQIKLEAQQTENGSYQMPLDAEWERPRHRGGEGESRPKDSVLRKQIRARLTIPGPKGLLWFLNVTLGFYLPQIVARNWHAATEGDVPIKTRMSGNGWDLQHAATNALRVADAKKEIFSCGTVFLDPTAYRRALEHRTAWGEESNPNRYSAFLSLTEKAKPKKTEEEKEEAQKILNRRHLLLRIWTSFGYSSGRYWAAYSLWRGLGFIGQLLEIGIQHPEALAENSRPSQRAALKNKLFRTIYTHGLQGISPGSLLNRNSDDQRLLQGFPKWEQSGKLGTAIEELAESLIEWLSFCWKDDIYPLPAGDLWLGWKDCFVRRVHGEYVLGSLMPRLNSAYLEEYIEPEEWARFGAYRSQPEKMKKPFEQDPAKQAKKEIKQAKKEINQAQEDKNQPERFLWSAGVAAGAWSDLMLEYWRGCPPVLK